MLERRRMLIGDWFDAAFYLVIGVLLGSVANGLVQLATTAFWPIAVGIVLFIAGMFLFEWFVDKLTNWVFPSGILPARKPRAQRGKSLLRLLSLPLGFVLGVALARLGLDKIILAAI